MQTRSPLSVFAAAIVLPLSAFVAVGSVRAEPVQLSQLQQKAQEKVQEKATEQVEEKAKEKAKDMAKDKMKEGAGAAGVPTEKPSMSGATTPSIPGKDSIPGKNALPTEGEMPKMPGK